MGWSRSGAMLTIPQAHRAGDIVPSMWVKLRLCHPHTPLMQRVGLQLIPIIATVQRVGMKNRVKAIDAMVSKGIRFRLAGQLTRSNS